MELYGPFYMSIKLASFIVTFKNSVKSAQNIELVFDLMIHTFFHFK